MLLCFFCISSEPVLQEMRIPNKEAFKLQKSLGRHKPLNYEKSAFFFFACFVFNAEH